MSRDPPVKFDKTMMYIICMMEYYVEKMGLAALEWIEAYDYGYKTQVWMKSEEWKESVLNLIVSQYLSH